MNWEQGWKVRMAEARRQLLSTATTSALLYYSREKFKVASAQVERLRESRVEVRV